ncbi:MAG: multicopper oxidase domain-containing protein [Leptolyngbyaceae cyanobacterium]
MINQSRHQPPGLWSRRQFLSWGAAGVGLVSASAILGTRFSRQSLAADTLPLLKDNISSTDSLFDPTELLREFDYGTIKQEANGPVREFVVTASSSLLKLNDDISLVCWNFNGRVPGPTLRAREGDRVRIIFHNQEVNPHSMHFHGTHSFEMDGVEPIHYGQTTVYEFEAEPFGVHPYHCHIEPVTQHISKGLYGLFIIDPPEDRPPADEMVLVMGGFDINEDGHNELYAFNGIPNYYRDRPISIHQNELVRIYLLNMIEFDPAVTFHIHANMFHVFPTGRTLIASEDSDVITLGTAERHILEFSYPYAGQYMFHPHQDAIAERGCMGVFNVLSAKGFGNSATSLT